MIESILVELFELDVTNPGFYRKLRKIDPGFTTEAMLNRLENYYEVNDESATKSLKNQSKNISLEVVSHKVVKDSSFLYFRSIANEPDGYVAELRSVFVDLESASLFWMNLQIFSNKWSYQTEKAFLISNRFTRKNK